MLCGHKTCEFSQKIRRLLKPKSRICSSLKGQQREMVFWLNPIYLVKKVRILKNFMLDYYLPRYPQFCVSLRLLHVRTDSISVLEDFVHAALNLPYSPYTLKYFQHILRIRRRNEEHAERNFHLQQCLGTLKGQYF